MSKMTLKGLKSTIKHYIDSGDYEGARNYARNFGDEFEKFNTNEALAEIDRAEKGNKKIKED
ncbi:hypothetical protein [Methanobacterium ferruginis]|uniref:hypothetical protein n=1 Tax=Methanobacterium ferruginis TaxID=710191 RepID=UPI002573D217|nr:hypothetical protein [Methanobacterium ferruginis]BDZ68598.1 hypothetical protein GCM10025860_20460 [Methanobacterium ferruginis]